MYNISNCLKKHAFYKFHRCIKPNVQNCEKLNEVPIPKHCFNEKRKKECMKSWTGSWKVVKEKCIHYEPSSGTLW